MRAFSESRAVTALSTPQLQGEGPVVLLSDLWAQDAAIPILHSRAVCVPRCLFRIFPSRPLPACDHVRPWRRLSRNLPEWPRPKRLLHLAGGDVAMPSLEARGRLHALARATT